MDFGTPLGFILGFVFVAAAILMHGNLRDFLDLPGALVTFGGSVSALFVMFPIRKVFGVFRVLKHCFLVTLPEPREMIGKLSDLAGSARREGLLALESRLPEIQDPFLSRGLEMLIDGQPREQLEEALRIELRCIQERHLTGKRIFEFLGASLPAFGMVGTLIGLIMMLNALDDPSRLGSGMAVAMVTTFYGVLIANLVFLPLAGKLDARSREETLLRELQIHGLAAMCDGDTPRTLEARLRSFLAPSARQVEAAA